MESRVKPSQVTRGGGSTGPDKQLQSSRGQGENGDKGARVEVSFTYETHCFPLDQIAPGANLEARVQPPSLSITTQPRVLRDTWKIEIIHLVIKVREIVHIQTVKISWYLRHR